MIRINSLTPIAISLLLPFALSFAFISSASAQQQAAPIMIQVNQLEIKPEMRERFLSIHRDVFMPAARANGAQWRLTNTTVTGNTLEVTVARPIENMAALDQPITLGMTDLEQQMALEIWQTAVQSRRSFVVTSRPDLSMEAAPNAGMSVRVHFLVKPGKDMEFAQLWSERTLPAMAASGIQGAQVFQTTAGGPGGEYYMLVPVANFTALDGPGPFSSLGQTEAQRLNADMGELMSSVQVDHVSTIQDLSFGLPGLQP